MNIIEYFFIYMQLLLSSNYVYIYEQYIFDYKNIRHLYQKLFRNFKHYSDQRNNMIDKIFSIKLPTKFNKTLFQTKEIYYLINILVMNKMWNEINVIITASACSVILNCKRNVIPKIYWVCPSLHIIFKKLYFYILVQFGHTIFFFS